MNERMLSTEHHSMQNGPRVEAVLSSAYEALGRDAREILKRLALAPFKDIRPWIIDTLSWDLQASAREVLDELLKSSLLTAIEDGLFEMHSLVGDLARSKAVSEHSPTELSETTKRVYLEFSVRIVDARRKIEPERPPVGGAASAHLPLPMPEEQREAEIWLQSEKANIVRLMTSAARRDFARPLINLAHSIPTCFIIRGTWSDSLPGVLAAAGAAKEISDSSAEGYCMQSLANIVRTNGWDSGREAIESSLQCFLKAKDIEGEAYIRNDLGLVMMYDREWQPALDMLVESENILRKIGNVHLSLNPLRNRGITYMEMGNRSKAIELLERACEGFRDRRDYRWLGFTLSDLGRARYLDLGPKQAVHDFEEAISSLRSVGDDRWAAVTAIRYGQCLRVAGEPDKARDILLACTKELQEAIGDPVWGARALVQLSLVNGLVDRKDAAVRALDAPMQTFRSIDAKSDQCEVAVARYRIQLALGDLEGARLSFEEAIEIAASFGKDVEYVVSISEDDHPDVR
ncbi:tetratricopeptide repeat protein [Gordonia sp. PKS22-38]|uniref:Tetratricopeptide repeat protein n=1 Tax=Gordonia prachuapensis TaxID=3115651 RepID=A0ABU7MYE6_9ACTN|nr:tetratricopeptide repeat protein [Gordonia sp. PKS22-38]